MSWRGGGRWRRFCGRGEEGVGVNAKIAKGSKRRGKTERRGRGDHAEDAEKRGRGEEGGEKNPTKKEVVRGGTG